MRQSRASSADAAPGSQHASYQEMLRAVGAILDEAGSNLALIRVSPRRVRVLAVGPYGEHVLSIRYLAHCIDVQRQLRGQLPPRDPVDLTRLSPVLRAVGAELDRQQQPRYDLAVTQGAVIIEGSRGYRRTLAFDVLAELLDTAIRSRGPSSID